MISVGNDWPALILLADDHLGRCSHLLSDVDATGKRTRKAGKLASMKNGALKTPAQRPAATAVPPPVSTPAPSSASARSGGNSSPIFVGSTAARPVYEFRPPSFPWLAQMNDLHLHVAQIVRPLYGAARQFDGFTAPPMSRQWHIGTDGNCLFRCFSVCLTGSQNYFSEIRQLLVRHMEQDEAPKFSDYIGMPITQYLDSLDPHTSIPMRDDGSWGTEKEMHAFADMFDCFIFVWNTTWSPTHGWLKYGPLPTGRGAANKPTILLLAGGDHYEVLLQPN